MGVDLPPTVTELVHSALSDIPELKPDCECICGDDDHE